MARDEVDEELLRIRRQSRRNRLIAAAIGAIPVLATCFFCTYPIAREVIGDRFEPRYSLTSEQAASARADVERARQAARENEAAFLAALPSLAALAPRDDLGAGCPYRLPTPEAGSWQVQLSIPPFPIHEVAPGAEASIRATSATASVESAAGSIERAIAEASLDPGHAQRVADQARMAISEIGPEVVLVVRDRAAAHGAMIGGGLSSFTGGYVRATAYLWVPTAQRFACAASVLSQSSESVDFTARMDSFGFDSMGQASLDRALQSDLEVQTWRAIATGMVAIGPRMTEEEIVEALGAIE